jgi:hypothetical protein
MMLALQRRGCHNINLVTPEHVAPQILQALPLAIGGGLRLPGYPQAARQAVTEMHRQVGPLCLEDGLARRGLLVRHLVMPGMLEETKAILRHVAEELGTDTYVNLMAQYRPAGLVGRSHRDGCPARLHGPWVESCHLAVSHGPVAGTPSVAVATVVGMARDRREDLWPWPDGCGVGLLKPCPWARMSCWRPGSAQPGPGP